MMISFIVTTVMAFIFSRISYKNGLNDGYVQGYDEGWQKGLSDGQDIQ